MEIGNEGGERGLGWLGLMAAPNQWRWRSRWLGQIGGVGWVFWVCRWLGFLGS